MSADTSIRRYGVPLVLLALLPLVPACGAAPDAEVEEVSDTSLVALGAEVYDEVCSGCHSLQPPPDQAPPITHVARHVRDEVEDREAFIAHVVSFVHAPAEDASLLPPGAVRRFGLMPAQSVSPERLEAAAAWLWVMADSAQHGMGEGEMHEGEMHQGGEGMRRGGMGEGMGGRGMGGGRHMGGPPPDTAG